MYLGVSPELYTTFLGYLPKHRDISPVVDRVKVSRAASGIVGETQELGHRWHRGWPIYVETIVGGARWSHLTPRLEQGMRRGGLSRYAEAFHVLVSHGSSSRKVETFYYHLALLRWRLRKETGADHKVPGPPASSVRHSTQCLDVGLQ